jgi:hypothetical protein
MSLTYKRGIVTPLLYEQIPEHKMAYLHTTLKLRQVRYQKSATLGILPAEFFKDNLL